MKHLVLAVLLCLSPVGVLAAKSKFDIPRVSLEEALNTSALLGHAVEIEACAGVPLSDAPIETNFLLLFPCGANLSDVDEKKVAMGRVTDATIFKLFERWTMGESPTFKGRFRGVLREDRLDGEDMKDVLVIDLSEVEFHASIDLE